MKGDVYEQKNLSCSYNFATKKKKKYYWGGVLAVFSFSTMASG